MGKTRQVLAVAVVATALCAADRTGASAIAPVQARPHAGLARQLAQRLTSSFRVAVPVITLERARQQTPPTIPAPICLFDSPVIHPAQSTPFHFRLPPPTTV